MPPATLLAVLASFDPTLRAVREQQYQREAPWVVDHTKFRSERRSHVTPHVEAIGATLAWFRVTADAPSRRWTAHWPQAPGAQHDDTPGIAVAQGARSGREILVAISLADRVGYVALVLAAVAAAAGLLVAGLYRDTAEMVREARSRGLVDPRCRRAGTRD